MRLFDCFRKVRGYGHEENWQGSAKDRQKKTQDAQQDPTPEIGGTDGPRLISAQSAQLD